MRLWEPSLSTRSLSMCASLPGASGRWYDTPSVHPHSDRSPVASSRRLVSQLASHASALTTAPLTVLVRPSASSRSVHNTVSSLHPPSPYSFFLLFTTIFQFRLRFLRGERKKKRKKKRKKNIYIYIYTTQRSLAKELFALECPSDRPPIAEIFRVSMYVAYYFVARDAPSSDDKPQRDPFTST